VPDLQSPYWQARPFLRLLLRMWRAFLVLMMMVGVLFLIVTFTPVDHWWAHLLAGSFAGPNEQQGDTLIVLGGARSTDGVISYSSYLRSSYALRAYRSGWVKVVVLAGDDADDPAQRPMHDFLVANGVPDAAIRVETLSTSTRENALFIKPLIQDLPGTKILMTSDYHSYRATRVFRKAGIPVVARPIPDIMRRDLTMLGRWPAFLDLCLENTKIVYYKARGWI
jgi:uncharacterized SAM-binding protein YcdF (DUF218 family)